MKAKIRNDKVKSLRKKTRKGKGFHGVPWWKKDKMQVDTVVDDDEQMEVELQSEPCLDDNSSQEILDKSACKLIGKEVAVDQCDEDPTIAHGFKIIDSSILQEVLNFCSKCKKCGKENCISLKQDDKAKRGLSEKLYVYCLECNEVIKTFYTSTTNENKLIDINLRSVHAATSSGGGLTLLRNFCGKMNLPAPVLP